MKKGHRTYHKSHLHKGKKGLSEVVSVVLIIALVIAAILIVWLLIIPLISDFLADGKKETELMSEKIHIVDIGSLDPSSSKVNMTISRGATRLVEVEVETITEEVIQTVSVPVDIVLIIDVSGSMEYYLDRDSKATSPDRRIDVAKEAAKIFVNSVLEKNSNARIGIMAVHHNITYNLYLQEDSVLNPILGIPSGQESQAKYNFTRELVFELSESNNNLINFIDSSLPIDKDDSWTISLSVGSLYCAALREADEYYSSRWGSEVEKYFIFLGDGVPVESYCSEYYNNATNASKEIHNFNDINISTILIGSASSSATPYYESIAEAGGGSFYTAEDANDLASTFETISNTVNVEKTITQEVSLPGVYLDLTFFFDDGYSYVHKITEDVPTQNSKKRYEITLLDERTWDEVEKIEIYLCARSSSGNNVCKIMSHWVA